MAAAVAVAGQGRFPVRQVAAALRVSRSALSSARRRSATSPGRAVRETPPELVDRVRALVSKRPTYGYRRVTALLNREPAAPRVNHKRIYRLMRAERWLLPRHTGRPTRPHDGQVITLRSNTRWCSDSFEIRCWSGERVHVVFAMDCCDREVVAFRAAAAHPTSETIQDLMAEAIEGRFGPGTLAVPAPLQWLSDNGPPYTAHATRVFGARAGMHVVTTPSYSPESNGAAEAFVKTFKRDYVYLATLHDAASVLEQLAAWFEDYNEHHPHRGLSMLSPREFRRRQVAA